MAWGAPLDTTPEAHALQRELYTRLGGRGRVEVMFRLTETVRRMTMAGIRARHPGYSESQVRQAYARMVLGDDLVGALWPECQLVDP